MLVGNSYINTENIDNLICQVANTNDCAIRLKNNSVIGKLECCVEGEFVEKTNEECKMGQHTSIHVVTMQLCDSAGESRGRGGRVRRGVCLRGG